MPQAPVPTYRVEYEPSRGSWLLTGPVGANGRLLFHSAQDSASHAKWNAREDGGKLEVYTDRGELFKTIELKPSEGADSVFILPSN